jgi:enterochelin esterase-like enzyme
MLSAASAWSQPTPHGDIRVLWYYSDITQAKRKINIYVPPDYDRRAQMRYPVLYLRHGGSQDADAWVQQGHVSQIMDDLLAKGNTEPMLVVMDDGYAEKPGEPRPTGMVAEFPPDSTVVRVEIKEVLPLIDATFRTFPDRDHRAMAGLSMGARQTVDITLNYPDTYSYIGLFSGPLVGPFSGPTVKDLDLKTAYGGLFADAARCNQRIHLLWLGAGTAEPAQHESVRVLHAALDGAGIHNVWVEFPGTSHEWPTWRQSLYDFAPRLFHQAHLSQNL